MVDSNPQLVTSPGHYFPAQRLTLIGDSYAPIGCQHLSMSNHKSGPDNPAPSRDFSSPSEELGHVQQQRAKPRCEGNRTLEAVDVAGAHRNVDEMRRQHVAEHVTVDTTAVDRPHHLVMRTHDLHARHLERVHDLSRRPVVEANREVVHTGPHWLREWAAIRAARLPVNTYFRETLHGMATR